MAAVAVAVSIVIGLDDGDRWGIASMQFPLDDGERIKEGHSKVSSADAGRQGEKL